MSSSNPLGYSRRAVPVTASTVTSEVTTTVASSIADTVSTVGSLSTTVSGVSSTVSTLGSTVSSLQSAVAALQEGGGGGLSVTPGYDIVVVAGQSNTYYGTGTLPPYAGGLDSRVMQYVYGVGLSPQLPTSAMLANTYQSVIKKVVPGTDAPLDGSGTVSFTNLFCKYYASRYLEPGRTVLFLMNGVSGTSIPLWLPGDACNTRLLAAIAEVAAVKPTGISGWVNRFVAFLWLQGEGDVGTAQATYRDRMHSVFNSVRTATGNATLPVIVSTMTDYTGQTGSGVDLAHRNIYFTLAHCATAISPTSQTDLHFSSANHLDIARAQADAYPFAVANDFTVTPSVPRNVVLSAISATTATLTFDMPETGHTDSFLLSDGTGGTLTVAAVGGRFTGLTGTLMSLTPEQAYTFSVRANNDLAGTHSATVTVSGTTTSPSLVGAPGALSIGAVSGGSCTISWAASTGSVSYYVIGISPDVAAQNGSHTTDTSFTFNSLTVEGSYAVSVTAHGPLNDSSASTGTIDVVTLATPYADFSTWRDAALIAQSDGASVTTIANYTGSNTITGASAGITKATVSYTNGTAAAIAMSGGTQYMLASGSGMQHQTFSCMFLVRWDSAPGDWTMLMADANNNKTIFGNTGGFASQVNAAYGLEMKINATDLFAQNFPHMPSAPSGATWYAIYYVNGVTTGQIYMNGVAGPAAAQPIQNALDASFAPLLFNWTTSANFGVNGKVLRFAWWNTALSAGQVGLDYAGLKTALPGLLP